MQHLDCQELKATFLHPLHPQKYWQVPNMHLWQYFRTSHVCEISTMLTVMNSVISSVFQPLYPLNLKHKITIRHLISHPTGVTTSFSITNVYPAHIVRQVPLNQVLCQHWENSEFLLLNPLYQRNVFKNARPHLCGKQITHVHIHAFAQPPWYAARIIYGGCQLWSMDIQTRTLCSY